MKAMGIHHDPDLSSTNGILMTLLAFFLYIIGRLQLLSVGDWASIMAIFAGLAAGAFNGYKLFMAIRNRKKKR